MPPDFLLIKCQGSQCFITTRARSASNKFRFTKSFSLEGMLGVFLLNILLKAGSKLIQTRTLFCPVLKIFAVLEITIRNGNTGNKWKQWK